MKLCKDCVHLIDDRNCALNSYEVIDYMTGNKTIAYDSIDTVRRATTDIIVKYPCGHDAIYFKAKNIRL